MGGKKLVALCSAGYRLTVSISDFYKANVAKQAAACGGVVGCRPDTRGQEPTTHGDGGGTRV